MPVTSLHHVAVRKQCGWVKPDRRASFGTTVLERSDTKLNQAEASRSKNGSKEAR